MFLTVQIDRLEASETRKASKQMPKAPVAPSWFLGLRGVSAFVLHGVFSRHAVALQAATAESMVGGL